ncbi:MAG TPA: zinc-ribbon domain-containing protein, partial [Haliangium sp.]|nr:zinc-ribbon domain-containing protein [Haliangium sp.]
MDVRCEKCGTEYELDDSRLRPAGVSVKCTSCGHVFRVRRHPVTSVGVGSAEALPPAPRRPDTERDLELPPMLDEDEPGDQISSDTIPMPTLTPGAPPGPRMGRMTPSNARALARRTKERNWLVRLPSGEIETCRELATLHQWIIAGKVTRNSGISRTGKSWKRLGEIRELEPFFDVAEETRRARMSGTPGTPADAPGARSVARPEARSAAKPGGRADAQGRQMPRVIQPIPDSFSASGP